MAVLKAIWDAIAGSILQGMSWGGFISQVSAILVALGLLAIPPFRRAAKPHLLRLFGHDEIVEDLKKQHNGELERQKSEASSKLSALQAEHAQVFADQKRDVDFLTVQILRDSTLIRLLNSLDKEILIYQSLDIAEQEQRQQQVEVMLKIILEVVSSAMPREPGDERGCLILVPQGTGKHRKLRPIIWNADVDSHRASRTEFRLDGTVSGGIAGKVFRDRKRYYAPDVTQDKFYEYTRTEDPNYRSLVNSPIIAPDGNKTLGVLSLNNTRVNAYSPGDCARMDWIAQKLGVTLSIIGPIYRPNLYSPSKKKGA